MEFYEIHLPCPECDGKGKIHYQTSVNTFNIFDCEHCNSWGYKVINDYYDNREEVLLDYTDAIKVEVEK